MKKIHYADKYLLNPEHQITVALIGVGGTGSQVLSALARIDHALFQMGHPGLQLTAYDPDIVTQSNIGRQLFSPSDLGLNKASVLVTRINRFFGIAWESRPIQFDFKETANITISCVDSVKSRIDIQKHFINETKSNTNISQYKELYWLDFGNARYTGQVVLGTVNPITQPIVEDQETVESLKTVGKLFDLSQLNDEDSGPSCSLAAALTKQDLFINSTLAQFGCAMLWHLFSTGSIDYHGVFLNLESMNVNPIRL